MVMTTLLTILMVVMIVGIIFLGTKSSIFKAQGEADKDKLCSETDILLGDFCYETQNILNVNTGLMESKTRINFHVKNNGQVPIESFLILEVDNAGNSIPLSTLMGSETEVNGIRSVTSDYVTNLNNIDKLKIYPQLLLKGEIFSCFNNEKILSGGELKTC